jgi:hypothetical protein
LPPSRHPTPEHPIFPDNLFKNTATPEPVQPVPPEALLWGSTCGPSWAFLAAEPEVLSLSSAKYSITAWSIASVLVNFNETELREQL